MGEWDALNTGAPCLRGAAVNFDCTITDMVEKGTHAVLFAQVVNLRLGGEAAGLIYFSRAYHRVG